eukprot:1943382-Rhodomonas_salina.2
MVSSSQHNYGSAPEADVEPRQSSRSMRNYKVVESRTVKCGRARGVAFWASCLVREDRLGASAGGRSWHGIAALEKGWSTSGSDRGSVGLQAVAGVVALSVCVIALVVVTQGSSSTYVLEETAPAQKALRCVHVVRSGWQTLLMLRFWELEVCRG